MKTLAIASMKVQRFAAAFPGMSVYSINHLQVYFCGIRPSLIFFDRGMWRHVCFHVSPRKGHLSLSSRGKNIMFSGKNTIFPDNTRKMLCQGGPFGKAIFSESLKKISYFRLFFERDHLSFSVQVARSYFQEKEILSFPIIQERSYSSGNFLERPSFQDVWKNKIWFSVQ